MKQGTVVQVAATLNGKLLRPGQFFVQGIVEDGDVPHDTFGAEANERVSRQVTPGEALIRVVHQDAEGRLFFSKPKRFLGKKGATNAFNLAVEPGSPFLGKLGPSVPRPVQGGWVNARVFYDPTGGWKGERLVWGDFAPVAPDGSFRLVSLPEGRVEVTAICDGFFAPGPIGKGPNGFVVPHSFELDETEVVIPMQRTATAEIRVLNDSGSPLSGVTVWFSPNIQWGSWWSTLFASDFYRTIDLLRKPGSSEPFRDSNRRVFHTTTDSNGVAKIRELPSWPLTFGVQHDDWEMPTEGAGERKRKLDLAPGMTNSMTVKLQKKGTEQLEE